MEYDDIITFNKLDTCNLWLENASYQTSHTVLEDLAVCKTPTSPTTDSERGELITLQDFTPVSLCTLLSLPGRLSSATLTEVAEALEEPFFCEEGLQEMTTSAGFLLRLKEEFHRAEADNSGELQAYSRLYTVLLHVVTPSALELLLSDHYYWSFFGALECDPRLNGVSYRQQLANVCVHNPLEVRDEALTSLFTTVFRIQFLKDSPTRQWLDVSALSTLNRLQASAQAAAISKYLETPSLRAALSEQISVHSLASFRFLGTLCKFASGLQSELRLAFYKILWEDGTVEQLAQHGCYPEWSVEDQNRVNSLVYDLVVDLYEFTPAKVQQLFARQVTQHCMLLHLFTEACQSVETLQQLTPLFLGFAEGEHCQSRTVLCDVFYDTFLRTAMQQLEKGKDIEWACHFIALVTQLLSHPSAMLRGFIIANAVVEKITQLASRHSVLALSAVQFMKALVSSKDKRLKKLVVRTNCLRTLLGLFDKHKDNAVSGALRGLILRLTRKKIRAHLRDKIVPQLSSYTQSVIFCTLPNLLTH